MIIRRATADDRGFIMSVYRSGDIWDRTSDDNTPALDTIDMTPILSSPGLFTLIPGEIGFFFFHPWNSITWEMHSAILPEHRGRDAMEGARLAGMWMFDNTPCQKIVTLVPQGNYRARALARKGGMVEEGTVTQSYLKNGQLLDQHLYGITKEVALCQ